MKSKQLLMKSLLAAFGLFVGANAWAGDPDLENDYTLVKSVTFGDGVNIAGTEECAYTAYDTGNKKQQKLTIITAPNDAAGWIAMQAWTDGSGKGWWNRQDKGLYCVNAGRSAAVFGDDLTSGWLVVFTCTQTASNVMSLTNGDGNPDGTFTYATSEDGKSFYCTITAAENAYIGFCGNKNAGFITTISVYKPNKAVIMSSYTVKFEDMSGNTLKDDVVYDGVAGSEISVTDADKANITVEETTYIYDSDDSEGLTIGEDGKTVVTVKFHEANNFTYTVNEVFGDEVFRETTGISYETAKVSVPYRKYNALNGQLYTKDATSKEYNFTFSLTEDNLSKNIEYTAVDGVDNVVFIAEGEDIEGLVRCNSANTKIRSSNSGSAYATANTRIVRLSAGTYKIHAIIYDASKEPNSNWIFVAGNKEVANINCTTVNIQEFDSEEFTLDEAAELIMEKGGNNNMGLDAIYITGTGSVAADLTSVDATIGAQGYATFASLYAVDLSLLPEGVTAYYASAVSETSVTLTEIAEAIPANTGIILKGEVNAKVSIPTANESTAISGNLLKGVTIDTTLDAADNLYVLANGEFESLAKNGATIPAGKAYLEAPGTGSRLSIIFEGEATGIKSLNSVAKNEAVYNLNGQRIAAAKKGLYIVDGKKMIVK